MNELILNINAYHFEIQSNIKCYLGHLIKIN